MVRAMEDVGVHRPAIGIRVAMGCRNEALLREVRCGVEEEAVLYEVKTLPDDDCVKLAFEGAQESTLEVGIGIDVRGRVAVHYKKLKEDCPLFEGDYQREPARIRSICSNAARLVKGIPFILD